MTPGRSDEPWVRWAGDVPWWTGRVRIGTDGYDVLLPPWARLEVGVRGLLRVYRAGVSVSVRAGEGGGTRVWQMPGGAVVRRVLTGDSWS